MTRASKVFPILKKILNILSYVLFGFLLLILVITIITRISGREPQLFGFHINVIVSGSMEPELEIGDVIVGRSYRRGQELAVGDVITYRGEAGTFAGKMITHEVIRIEEINGERIITTQGTANNAADAPIGEDQILSVMVYKTFLIKYIYSIISSTAGFLLLVALPLVIIIVSEVVSIVKQLKEKDEEEDKNSEEEKDNPNS